MESQPTIRQRFNSDLQNRLALIAYVPILCLGVLAAGGLIFLRDSSGVRVYGVFALLGVALSILVAYRTIGSVLDSIGRAATSAQALAEAQQALLDDDPEPIERWEGIEAGSGDELGQLGSALESLHGNTLQVNRNQSESIRKGISNIVVNLARRSQALLDRQVEYIDQLENSEENPDRLEQMFKVDHLATRMRRNAESLLVLADADPGRRRGGPIAIADVLRVAMGEIENYKHIELTAVEPGQITAAAAVDLAHLAAELMENATQFSPPNAPVEVSGTLDDEHYVIRVVDHGMGMPDDQLELANATFAEPPDLGLAMGRSLGFVVIGRLAQRVGATVSLSETPDSGVTASILVPTSVFSSVGDNSGVRRSLVAPEPELDEPELDDAKPSRSPALSKLLGLDVANLGSATDTAEPAVEVEAQAEVEQDKGWTPPPVTPDAPIVGPAAELQAEAPVGEPEGFDQSLVDGLGEGDQGWTPPSVTRDESSDDGKDLLGSRPVADTTKDPFGSAVAETDNTADDADNEDVTAEPVAEEADESDTGEHAQTGSSAVESLKGGGDSWTPPPVTPDAKAETVRLGAPPKKLEDALPTGEAFESGMASLLDDKSSTTDSPFPAEGAATPLDPSSPTDAAPSGLSRRQRGESDAPTGESRPVAASSRNPEEKRSMLSRYRDGIKGNKSPDENPDEEG